LDTDGQPHIVVLPITKNQLEPNPHNSHRSLKLEADGSNARLLRPQPQTRLAFVSIAWKQLLFIEVFALSLTSNARWHAHCTLTSSSRNLEIGIAKLRRNRLMLWTILVILLVLWLLGFIGHVGGGLIHLLLVIALVIFIINIVSGRRTV
jgi:hypothetical protein